jgi:hypothetical protein
MKLMKKKASHFRFLLGLIILLVFWSCSTTRMYTIDQDTVYYNGFSWGSGGAYTSKIQEADPESFVALKGSDYAKDKNHVYYHSRVVKDADPETFIALSEWFGKDKKQAFYGEYSFEVQDVEALEVYPLEKRTMYLRDGIDYYNVTSPMEVENYKQFRIIRTSNGFSDYTTDGVHFWYDGDKIDVADMDSFRVIDRYYAQDKLFYYWGGERREDPPHNFDN